MFYIVVNDNKHEPTGYLFCFVCIASSDMDGWRKGVVYAEGQNLARLLMEAPANYITPTAFANTIEEKLAAHAERVSIHRRFVLLSTTLTELIYRHF